MNIDVIWKKLTSEYYSGSDALDYITYMIVTVNEKFLDNPQKRTMRFWKKFNNTNKSDSL